MIIEVKKSRYVTLNKVTSGVYKPYYQVVNYAEWIPTAKTYKTLGGAEKAFARLEKKISEI